MQSTFLGAVVLAMALPAAGESTSDGGPGVSILGKDSAWRFFLIHKAEQVRRASGELESVRFGWAHKTAKVKPRRSASPPADWAQPDFDDAAWPRRPCPLNTSRNRVFSLICARGRFGVDDPKQAGDLRLSVAYRGGVVIYVNGKELTRSHIRKGDVDFDTPAENYPKDVYLDPDGFLLRLGFHDPQKYAVRFKRRTRTLSDVRIPASMLRKGVNVLAIEVHRPLTDEVLYTGKPRQHSKGYCQWSTLALGSLTLSTVRGARGVSGSDPPGGLQVWNQHPAQRVLVTDFGDPHEPVQPIEIHGARNGSFSGQVVVGSTATVAGLKVTASALKAERGALIPASAVQIRCAVPDGPPARRGGTPFFDGLDTVAPTDVPVRKETGRAIQPIWVTVQVPREATLGGYDGTLTISTSGAEPIIVPIKLTVADWVVPEPKDSASWFGLVQSPDTVAMAYNVPMWSEKHWALLEKSFELMGQVGTRIIYVPLIRQTHFGNQHSMVRWMKQADGSWQHDFSVFERYLDMAIKHLGRLDVVCLHCWARTSGGAYFGRGSKESKPLGMRFTVLGADGELEEAEGPTWNAPDARAFWRPVLGGIRQRMAERGVSDAMMVGIAHDVVPSKACVEVLKDASGSAPWVVHCHPQRWQVHDQPVGYLGDVWSSPSARYPDEKRQFGWQAKRLRSTFPRAGSSTVGTIRVTTPPAQYRVALEGAMAAGLRGYGWIGADFWPVLKDKRGRVNHLLDRYTYDRRTNLGIHHAITYVLRPGKEGPIGTVRHEMVRQGLQETEARVFIEKALADPAKRARLGEALAARCQALLDDRLRTIIWAKSHWDVLLCHDWDGAAGRLYAAAAEVASLTTD